MHLYCVVQTDYDLNLVLEHCALSLAIFIHDIPPHSRINDFPTRRVRLLDLKPDNVLLTEALEGKLCDLGLARNAEGSVVFTLTNAPYMSQLYSSKRHIFV